MNKEILIAGFGGQGVLFAGKFLAYKGLLENKEVSWLPSYGPEMRGGTANCSVIISDSPVGSPIVSDPDILIAMNLPSLDKYENNVKKGGIIFADSTLISRKINRTDITVYYVPATQIAVDNGISTLANMIIIGKLMAACEELSHGDIATVLGKVVSARKQNLYDANLKALELGKNYK